MREPLHTLFDHSRHELRVDELDAVLDVLTFTGEEQLSRPSIYIIEFTSTTQDISAERMLGKPARFTLHTASNLLPKVMRGLPVPTIEPLRTLRGVVTGFKCLSASRDEARYEITLEPRMALLSRGKQYRLYQHLSVPEIVDRILRGRHGMEGQDFRFDLVREYPRREQVMQFGESDLAFISRLLAEVGIWFRFAHDTRLDIDVIEFHDDQRHYQWPQTPVPCRSLSGLDSNDQDAVWQLQSNHCMVEKNIHFRAYDPRDANAWLDGEVDQSRRATTTYGEAYHYAEPYSVLGDALDQDEDLESESGFFYARLRHERYLNARTRLSGVSSSATLALAQILSVTGDAPHAFEPGAVITRLSLRAARDRSFEVTFEAIPYSETICFRPPVPRKPQLAGTVAARVTSVIANDPYGHIDREGRYKVNFLFDRDAWESGEESAWLRLARPYAGDTHGLHLPLIAGTEVAVAFEHGDPDRPYIAHALHDDQHPDPVTLANRDFTRNVLRTPSNNKLRMEDERGKEHVKLSTDHSGKSQLNLGHLVDARKQRRGEGFELRTDGRGAIRGGKGLFITADEQAGAQGQQLEMASAITHLQHAVEQLQGLSRDAQASRAEPAAVQTQLDLLEQNLEQLQSAVLLLSAPQGIALTSGKHLQLAAHDNLMLNAGGEADISVVKRMSELIEDQALSLLTSAWSEVSTVLDPGRESAIGQKAREKQRDAQSAAAYRMAGDDPLLLEYFSFPEKFMFVTLKGLEQVKFEANTKVFELEVVLSQPWPRGFAVSAEHVRLHAVPVINLFALEADPLALDPLQTDYRVRPMQAQDGHTEIYSVDSVIAAKSSARHVYVPFSSFQHKGGMLRDDAPERYFHTRLKRAPGGLHDLWLILGGDGFDLDRSSPAPRLSLQLTGTHGQLPRMALAEAVLDEPAQPRQRKLAVRNLCATTMPCYAPDSDRFHWRVLSQLGSSFLPMLDNAEVLRNTLALYNWTDNVLNQRRLQAIVEVRHYRIERFERGFLLRGVGIEVTVDAGKFAGDGDICLFGEVLSRFFAQYADIHLFNQLTMILQPQDKCLRWKENHSERVPG
jgi:type VI secretion system secreted protein VgrG